MIFCYNIIHLVDAFIQTLSLAPLALSIELYKERKDLAHVCRGLVSSASLPLTDTKITTRPASILVSDQCVPCHQKAARRRDSEIHCPLLSNHRRFPVGSCQKPHADLTGDIQVVQINSWYCS